MGKIKNGYFERPLVGYSAVMMVGTVAGKFHSSILIKQGVLPHAIDGRLIHVYTKTFAKLYLINRGGVCAAQHDFKKFLSSPSLQPPKLLSVQ